jgi:hypothetical protein
MRERLWRALAWLMALPLALAGRLWERVVRRAQGG